MKNNKRTFNIHSAALIVLMIIATIGCLSPLAFGAGGDVVWEYGDTPQIGKQEAKALAIDSSGDIIVTGHSDQSGSLDYYTIKISADGSGIIWSKSFDMAGGNDYAIAVILDSNDNPIVTGYAFNGVNYDYHTIKYAGSDGAVVWEHSFNSDMAGNDYATSIAIDSLNNTYVGGYAQGANGADDFMIVKYSPVGPNPDGTPIWQVSYNGSANGHDRISSITAGIDGIAVTGQSQNSVPDFDVLTIKYGFDSSLKWEKRKAGSGDDRGMALKMDSTGNVLMTGFLYNGTDKDIYTAKYNTTTGLEEWEVTYNGGYDDAPADMYIDSTGDAYITGYSFVLNKANDFYTAKYAGSTGVLQWGKTYNSSIGNVDEAVSIVVDESGDLFVTGDSYDYGASNYNYQTLKYKKDNGNLLWEKIFDGTPNKDDRPAGIGVASSGDVIVAGWSDIWTAGASDHDYYVVKYDPGLLNPPTNLAATTISTMQIDLSWSDNSLNEDGFRIERKIGEFGTFSEIGTSGPDTPSFSDTGLIPDTKYIYRVRAYNSGDGDSYYTNEVSAVTTLMTFAAPSVTYTYAGADNGDDFVSALASGPDYDLAVTGYSYSDIGQFNYYTLKLNNEDLGLIWDAAFDSDQNDMDIAVSVLVDDNNDVLVSGYSNLFSVQSGGNTNDIYSIKYPSTGPPEDWNDQYNGPAGDDDRSSVVDVSSDGNNSYVVVGYGRNADWNDDIYVVKYLVDGTREWAAVPYDGGVFGHDYPSAVAFDSNGDIILAGYTYNGTDYDFVTRKYSGIDGSPIWTDVYNIGGTGNDFTRALALDAEGNIYVTGVAVTASGNEDFYTIKYDSTDGTRLWERSFNGIGNGVDEAVGVKVDLVNGDIVVAGTTLKGTDNNDIHLVRYDSDGTVVWERTLDRPDNNDFAVAMSIDLTGNVIVSGDTDNGSPTDIISVQYTYEGVFRGGLIYDSGINDYDGAADVEVNILGEAFVGGYKTNSNGDADYIVFKMSNNFLQAPTPFTAVTNPTQADLYWSDNSLNEDGYHLERKLGTCNSGGTWTELQTLPVGTLLYIDSTLNLGASYCYRVRSYTDAGQTSRWIEREVTTGDAAPPSDLVAVAVSSTEVDLSWTDTTGTEDGFIIERCSGVSCTVFSEIATVAANIVTFRDTGSCASGTYSYRVKAYRTVRWTTGYSNEYSVTTPAASDNMVFNFSAARMSESEISMSWTGDASDESGYKIERCLESASDCSQDASFAEVADLNTSSFQPGLLFHMDEAAWSGAANDVTDSSGSNHNGTTNGGANTIAEGKFGRAGDFDGTNDYISVPNSSAINPSTAITVELWAKSDTATWNSSYMLASKRNSYILGPISGGTEMRFYIYSSGAWRYASYTPSISITEWHHYAGTFDGTNIRLFIDGVQVGVTSYSGTISSDTGPLSIGRDDGQTRYFDGKMDDVAVYSRALGVTEITAHYNQVISPDSRSYIDTGLDPSETYTYRMKSYKSATCSWETGYSGSGSAETTIIGPSDLIATTLNTTQINIEWKDNTAFETGFILERCLGASCDFSSPDKTYNVGPSLTAFSDTEVCEGQTYRYRIRADRNVAPLWQSDWNDTPATAATPSISASAPDSLTATAISESETDIVWTSNSFDETGFSIERCTGSLCSDYLEVATVEPLTGALLLLAMDEAIWTGASNEIIDTSGQGFHGTAYNGVTTIAEGYYGRAGSFDGANDFVETDLFIDQSSGSAGVTMEAWVYPTSISSGKHQLISTDNGGFDWSLLRNEGTWTVYNGSAEFSTGLSVDLNEWQHVAVVFKSPGVTFYKNGYEVVSNATISYDSNDASIVIGRRAYGSENFAGRIDEVGVYDRQLSASEIALHYETGIQANTTKRYRDKGLNPATLYQYRVSAYKSATCGWATGYTSEAPVTTDNVPSPSDLVLTVNDTTTIGLLWIDNTTSETGFTIERCDGAGCDFSTVAATFTVGADITEYSDNTLCESTSYSYRVRADKDDGPIWASGWSASTAETTATTDTKAAPENLLVTVVNESEIRLDWTDNVPDETGFKLLRCMGVGCTPNEPLPDLITVDPELLLAQYTDTGLQTNATYRYRVWAYKDGSCPWESDFIEIDSNTVPPPPENLLATKVNSTQIDLSWDDRTAAETGFKIERCTGAECTVFEEIGTVPTDVTAYSDIIDVCENTQYNYRVKAYTAGWETLYSNESSAITDIKAAPSNLTATRVSEMRIDLSWTDNTIDETEFRVERCSGTGCTAFEQIAVLDPNKTVFSDTGLLTDTDYTYQIRAYKDADCSWLTDYSNTDTAVTTISDPAGLSATAVSTTQIDLAWTDNTSSETAFRIQRCTYENCNDFTDLATLGKNETTYLDISACNSTSYTYRVMAMNAGLSGSGGGCWTRRSLITINGFERETATQVIVVYDSDMNLDFSDIRFFDETAGIELPYWLDSKTNGVTATFYFETAGNDNVYMYYGNASAVSVAGENLAYEFRDDFNGDSIDSSKWNEIDPNNSIAQNNDLVLNDVSDAWNKALISTQTFSREDGKEIYVDLTISPDTMGNNHFMVGWELDQTSNPSYNQLVHGFYWNNYKLTSYEKGSHTGPNTQGYAQSTYYEMKVVLKIAGARYYVKGGAYSDWTLVKETSAYSDATMRIAFTQYSHQAKIHSIKVGGASITELTSSFGIEEQSACFTFGNTWNTGYSNDDSAVTVSLNGPTVLANTAVMDTQSNLSWNDNSIDETGFEIERCEGDGCTDFEEIDIAGASMEMYSDPTLSPETSYCYRVRAYKDAVCGWQSDYSNESCDLTFSARPTNLNAIAQNSLVISLDWTDNSNDEEGFELEKRLFNGTYIKIATLGPNVTTFTNWIGVEPEKEYNYRVRAFRGTDKTPYSNVATVTTPAWQEGDETCIE